MKQLTKTHDFDGEVSANLTASFFGSNTMAKQSCGRIEINSIAISFKHLDLTLASCNSDMSCQFVG